MVVTICTDNWQLLWDGLEWGKSFHIALTSQWLETRPIILSLIPGLNTTDVPATYGVGRIVHNSKSRAAVLSRRSWKVGKSFNIPHTKLSSLHGWRLIAASIFPDNNGPALNDCKGGGGGVRRTFQLRLTTTDGDLLPKYCYVPHLLFCLSNVRKAAHAAVFL